MGAIQEILGLATTLAGFALLTVAVMKLNQMATDLQEMKQMMAQSQLTQSGLVPRGLHSPEVPQLPRLQAALATPASPGAAPGTGVAPVTGAAPGTGVEGPAPAMSAEELVRAVHAQNFKGEEFPL